MTPRNRILAASALVAVLTIPVGAAVAGRSNTVGIATATGTSLSTTTAVPATTEAPPTTAPTTAAPDTTSAPTTTEAPTVAPTTAAPVTTAPAPTPIATPVAVPTPSGFKTSPPVDAKTAFEQAAAMKRAADEAAAAATPPASTPPPDPAPAPAPAPADPAPAPIPSDDPLQSLSIYDQQFLGCVRWRESRDNYGAVNSSSGAGGAYQFLQNTWNNTAAHLGRGDLIGTRPNYASKYDQDSIAVHLLQWYGRSPWAGPGC